MSKPAWMKGAAPAWVTPGQKPLPMSATLPFQPLLPEIIDILGENGILHSAGMDYRSQQMNLANLISHSVRNRRNGVFQAGTGAGKSYGYMVPALLHALQNKKRVVVATSQIQLQEQIINEDFPALVKILRPYFEGKFGRVPVASEVYGRSNYLCVAKHSQAMLPGMVDGAEAIIQTWADHTKTGRIAESGLNMKAREYLTLKMAYTATGDECPGKKACDWGESCYYYGALAQLERADLLVVNHAVLAAHFRCGRSILPEFDLVIVDEAHNWEESLVGASIKIVSYERLEKLQTKAEGLIGTERTHLLERKARAFFDALSKEVNAQNAKRLVRTNLDEDLKPLAEDMLAELEGWSEQLGCHEHTFAGICAGLLDEFAADVTGIWDRKAGVLMPHRTEKGVSVELVRADVSDISKRMMQGCPWIFTSATLATSNDMRDRFKFFRKTLGISTADEYDVGSPLNYKNSLLYYIPQVELPKRTRGYTQDKEAADFAQAFASEYRDLLKLTQGHALLLFTSYKRMQAVWDTLHFLYGELPWPSRAQGGADTDAELISWFRSTPGAVLFSVTLWEGMNAPGSIRMVNMDRFPMPPSDDPIFVERCSMAGGYKEAAIPRALIRGCQGAGRLKRCHTDRGLVSIMDPRLTNDPSLRGVLQCYPGKPGAPGSNRVLRKDELARVAAAWWTQKAKVAQ